MANFVAVKRVLAMLEETGLADGVLRIEGDGRLLAGPASGRLTHVLDLERGRVARLSGSDETVPNFPAPRKDLTTGRRSGVYAIEIGSYARTYPNLRALLIGTLRKLAEDDETFLERLSQEKGRTRRLVAKRAVDLFPDDKPYLAEKGAAELTDGWWVNTNNSKDAVKVWLHRAVSVAGIDPSRDLRVSF